MNDKPRKASRSWIGWALAATLVLYPLSIGPVTRLAIITNCGWNWINTIYAPVLSAAELPGLSEPLFWYLDLWGAVFHAVPEE
jgi:hypothetical protein